MVAIALEALEAPHIRALVEDQVPESRSLEFKAVVGKSEEDKREFLYDASSFANAAGGEIFLGVAEAKGIAVELPGVAATEADGTILRLENLLRDGIEPRIPGVRMRAV